jgi:peptidoglycan/LPS O-acetylase OafA/YrhL
MSKRTLAGGADASHMVQLDGLRAIAALAVVVHHNVSREPGNLQHEVSHFLDLGRGGVRLFFVLSGFLITGILLRARFSSDKPARGHIAFAFYARRFLRIFPLYYFAVVAVALLVGGVLAEGLPWHLLYLSNVYMAIEGRFPGPPVSHLWSLSVEEQFYIFWAALVLLTPRKWLLPAMLSTLVVAPLSRFLIYRATSSDIAAGVLTPSCLDTLGIGASLACLWESGYSRAAIDRLMRWGLAAGLAALLAVKVSNALGGETAYIVFVDSAYALIFAWIINGAARGFGGPAGWFLQTRPLVYLGTISYGIYVYHHMLPPVIMKLSVMLDVWLRFPTEFGIPRTLYVTAASILTAALSYHLFEAPINRLKRYFPYARPRPEPAPVPAEPAPGDEPAAPPVSCPPAALPALDTPNALLAPEFSYDVRPGRRGGQ